MITFAGFSCHPPILLPSVGSKEDRLKVKKTLNSLELLSRKFKDSKSDIIIISSPHPDWGFKVPLYFIANNFKGKIETLQTGLESPDYYFQLGEQTAEKLDPNKRYGLIGSGDLSHCLKPDGPYGFHPDGPKFDKAFIKYLKGKNIKKFLELDNEFPQAEDCGLRPFSFILGILEGSKINWTPEILSYEGPFGVGYLVANFKLS